MTLSIAEQETFKVRIERLESDVRELSSSQKATLDLLQEVRKARFASKRHWPYACPLQDHA